MLGLSNALNGKQDDFFFILEAEEKNINRNSNSNNILETPLHHCFVYSFCTGCQLLANFVKVSHKTQEWGENNTLC